MLIEDERGPCTFQLEECRFHQGLARGSKSTHDPSAEALRDGRHALDPYGLHGRRC